MDRFVAVLLTLAQELWVTRERVDLLERLSADQHPFIKQHIDALLNDAKAIAERDAKVGEFVTRVLSPLREP